MTLHIDNKQTIIMCSSKHCYVQVNVPFTEYWATCKNIAQFELTKYYKLTKLRFYYCIQKLATACIMMKVE